MGIISQIILENISEMISKIVCEIISNIPLLLLLLCLLYFFLVGGNQGDKTEQELNLAGENSGKNYKKKKKTDSFMNTVSLQEAIRCCHHQRCHLLLLPLRGDRGEEEQEVRPKANSGRSHHTLLTEKVNQLCFVCGPSTTTNFVNMGLTLLVLSHLIFCVNT